MIAPCRGAYKVAYVTARANRRGRCRGGCPRCRWSGSRRRARLTGKTRLLNVTPQRCARHRGKAPTCGSERKAGKLLMRTTTLRPQRLAAMAIFALLVTCIFVAYGRISAQTNVHNGAARIMPILSVCTPVAASSVSPGTDELTRALARQGLLANGR